MIWSNPGALDENLITDNLIKSTTVSSPKDENKKRTLFPWTNCFSYFIPTYSLSREEAESPAKKGIIYVASLESLSSENGTSKTS